MSLQLSSLYMILIFFRNIITCQRALISTWGNFCLLLQKTLNLTLATLCLLWKSLFKVTCILAAGEHLWLIKAMCGFLVNFRGFCHFAEQRRELAESGWHKIWETWELRNFYFNFRKDLFPKHWFCSLHTIKSPKGYTKKCKIPIFKTPVRLKFICMG